MKPKFKVKDMQFCYVMDSDYDKNIGTSFHLIYKDWDDEMHLPNKMLPKGKNGKYADEVSECDFFVQGLTVNETKQALLDIGYTEYNDEDED